MPNDQTQEYRKARLAAAADKAGGKAALGRLLGYKDGAYIGQMLRGDRPIKEDTVRKLEDKRGFAGWFSAAPSPNISEPPAPPASFEDNRTVDHADWELLQAFKIAATEEERAAITGRYKSIKALAEQIARQQVQAKPRP